MATQKESSKISDLDKRLSIMSNDFKYTSIDIVELKGDLKGLRADFKELSGVIAALSFATHQDLEKVEQAIYTDLKKNYVSKVTYEKLASKVTPIFWFAGVMAAAVITGIVGAIITFVVKGGLTS